MHRCSGDWLPQLAEYCCCDSGYAWVSGTAGACVLKTTTPAPPDFEQGASRGRLLFCETFDEEDQAELVSPGLITQFNEAAVQKWVAEVLTEAGYDGSVPQATAALEKHHVNGEALVSLSPWQLMAYGIDEGPAEIISSKVQTSSKVEALSWTPLRRLSSGTSGCAEEGDGTRDDGDASFHTGSSGCTEGAQEHHRGLHTGSKGCSKSSTGTRGCHQHHSSGARGCHSNYKSGSQGCHHVHHAARGCDSGVQGCHSGVCGCQDRSDLGDAFAFLLLFPFVLLVAVGLVVHSLAALPIVLAYWVAFPVFLAMVAFSTGSFLALLCSGCSAVVWAAGVVWIRLAGTEADGSLLNTGSGED
ncbi:unnamed protein product [Symbiodinium natans]|uniref:SAM domain-containing protein n=1 Tax=Symbiodinium natans TaxID=878477 RepID=A0A812H3D4_9DINO|nr:unnamed protein product [Symbiodinium natans]